MFDVTSAFTLNSVDVFNLNTTGTLKIQLQNSSGTPIYTTGTLTIPGGGTSDPYTVPLGWNIPVGTGYQLVAISGTAGLMYESFNYAISLGSWGSITSGANASSYYFFFYNSFFFAYFFYDTFLEIF